jgi:hypothetical protein
MEFATPSSRAQANKCGKRFQALRLALQEKRNFEFRDPTF